MLMKAPKQNPEYALVETAPPLAARLRYKGGNKVSTTYDLVEQMHFLYVIVVKAKELPVVDISGSLDPYVEVKLGNYKGVSHAAYGYKDSPMYAQIENCVQLAIIA
ncbi:FT-interacting protein [Trifolium repens]|nr:FT-interacting protein [Trifolium repens]KAK2406351.1 FT-interacting protein [Trifolium repens]